MMCARSHCVKGGAISAKISPTRPSRGFAWAYAYDFLPRLWLLLRFNWTVHIAPLKVGFRQNVSSQVVNLDRVPTHPNY